ncbi:heterokaryon incompatibility protein-domain-containing protein [Podospora aff. communis PSN243]|uniref:Heterokaryon incompatibility protein-domain-containing protein n=1 Tax=Podospora aff. communis PSN243 TaxID=3040156 RepID=A0AAV9GSF8_9PEZI|nr:heterokaryon incompatibility protein-domain-containing protein [Podospora aff. communis PSN243]
MDRYHYQALSDSDSIRLLYVGKDDSKPHAIFLSLKEVHLTDEPEFAAVSYTWQLPEYLPGQLHVGHEPGPGQDYVVECDGKAITISENLFRFLLSAVQTLGQHNVFQQDSPPPKSTGFAKMLSKRPLWIDAFCINQTDLKERQHQVLLMDKIYSRAQSVVVWLGDKDPGHDLIWVHDTFIPMLARISRQNPAAVAQFVADPLCKSARLAELLGPDVCSRWAFSWMSFSNFLDRRRWFHRGWVVQEVALARADNVLLLSGKKELRWTRLTAFSHFLQKTGWASSLRTAYNANIGLDNLARIPKGKAPGPLGAKIRAIDEAHRMITARETEPASNMTEWYYCASDLISKLRSSRFEDPRDHIYGCLGMLSRTLPEGCSNPIVPDYGKTVREVFTSVAVMMLTNLPGLSELTKVEDPRYRSQESLPSWVPDYSVPHRGNIGLAGTALPPTISTGHDDLPTPDCASVVVGAGLMLRGAKLASIDGTSLTDPWSWSDLSSFHDALFTLLMEAESLHDDFIVQDVWTTLARGNIDTYRSNPEKPVKHGGLNVPLPLKKVTESPEWETPPYKYWQHLDRPPRHAIIDHVTDKLARVHRLSKSTELMEAAKTVLALFKQINVEKPYLGEEPLDTGIWDVLSSSALYVVGGQTLGIGPVSASSKTRDEVWMLEGSDSLFVLRKAEGSLWGKEKHGEAYHLIGETYVCGVDVEGQMRKVGEQSGWMSIVLV